MNNSYKICICGSRTFDDYKFLKQEVDKFIAVYLPPDKSVMVVSGMANGADTLAIRYAVEKGYKTKNMPAEWDKFGKRAGFIRNANMLEVSDAVIAFLVGNSPGTRDMIHISMRSGKPIRAFQASFYLKSNPLWIEKNYN